MPLLWVLVQIGQHCTTILWVEVKIASSSYCILVELRLNMMQQCQRLSAQGVLSRLTTGLRQLASVRHTDSHLHTRE